MEHKIINENYSMVFHWNHDTSFAEIYFLQSKNPNVYRQVGTVLTYFNSAAAESVVPHWKGECYLLDDHFKDNLIDDILKFLLNNTKCKSPFWLNINKAELYYGKYRQVGNLTETD